MSLYTATVKPIDTDAATEMHWGLDFKVQKWGEGHRLTIDLKDDEAKAMLDAGRIVKAQGNPDGAPIPASRPVGRPPKPG